MSFPLAIFAGYPSIPVTLQASFFFFFFLLIVLLTAVLPCSTQTSGNEAKLPFSRRAPA